MVCPRCGEVLGDGNMYCEFCGEEIQIVPEFMPELESSIESSLQGVAKEMGGSNEGLNKSKTTPKERKAETTLATNIKPTYLLGIAMIIVVLICAIGIMIYHDNSADYQMKKGNEQYEAGHYKNAAMYYKNAVRLEPENLEYRLKLADMYLSLENVEAAIVAFEDVLEFDPENTIAYAEIISLYEKYGKYGAINEFLLKYANENMQKEFVNYLALPPEFSYEEGDYNKILSLTLTDEALGTIFYTLDGSEPNESSPIYGSAIDLTRGSYVVKAVFINEYGVASETVSKKYEIMALAPDAPIISLDSGEYDVPQLIQVTAPIGCSIYYTLDGSEPDANSRIYGEALPLEEGISHYKFVAISSGNVPSEVVERNYVFNAIAPFTKEQGLNMLTEHLVNIHYLTDVSGSSANYPGKFSYLFGEMRSINGIPMYCYNEYYVYGQQAKAMTSNKFGVDWVNGAVYLIKHSEGDNYTISLFK